MYLAVTSPVSGEAFALILRTRGVGQQKGTTYAGATYVDPTTTQPRSPACEWGIFGLRSVPIF